MEQLLGLGISWVWMGLEGEDSQYTKLHGIDVRKLVKRAPVATASACSARRSSAWRTTRPRTSTPRSTTPSAYDTDFHQFMLYTPIPGTPLHAELTAKGVMKDESEFEPGDIHGQIIFNYRHPHDSRRSGRRVHAPGVRPRLRAERPERRADRPNHAGRLPAAQEPPRPAGPPALRLRSAGTGHDVLGAGRRGEALLPRQSGDEGEDVGRCSTSCTPSSACKSRSGEPVGGAGTSCGRSAARRSVWPRAGPTSRRRSTSGTSTATTIRPPRCANAPRPWRPRSRRFPPRRAASPSSPTRKKCWRGRGRVRAAVPSPLGRGLG